MYSLGLQKAEPREGLDFLQIQICRRLFWEIYQSDKCVPKAGLNAFCVPSVLMNTEPTS